MLLFIYWIFILLLILKEKEIGCFDKIENEKTKQKQNKKAYTTFVD
jgi:hypothetical protein